MDKIEVGQIWQEVDPRFDRLVRIIEVGDEKVKVKTVRFEGKEIDGNITRCAHKRFNGARGGYTLIGGTGDGR